MIETFGVGGAALYSIKYTPAHDGGRTHKKIALCNLTPCTPFNDCLADDEKRVRSTAPKFVSQVDENIPVD